MAVIELVSQFGKEWAECERKCQMPLEIRALPSPLCSSPLSFCLLSVSLLSHVLILSACYANPALFYLSISSSSFPPPHLSAPVLFLSSLCCLIKPLVCSFFYLQPDVSVCRKKVFWHVRHHVNQVCGIKHAAPKA